MTAQAADSRPLDTSSAQREPGQRLSAGKSGNIPGVANEQTITLGCAEAFRGIGADLCITDLGRNSRTFTEPLAQNLDVPPALALPCKVHLRAHTRQ